MSAGSASCTAVPPPATWRHLIASSPEATPESLQFRKEMNLPDRRPLLMTGHQAAFWHPGILAKYLAAQAGAEALRGCAAWIIPDQDASNFAQVSIPRRVNGRLTASSVSVAPEPPAGVPIASCPPFDPPDVAGDASAAALESVSLGLQAMRQSLRAHRDAANAAVQMASAVHESLKFVLTPRPTIYASQLHRTTVFRELLARMRLDPPKMASSYNAAVRRHPASGVAPLRIEPSRVELPLWRLAPMRPRARVWSNDAPDDQSLAPRALFMTGILRLAGCDLFIHGLGGGDYDPVTEDWFQAWLGRSLAPAVVVTADLRLPLTGEPVTPAEVAAAKWKAHRAKHDPALLGDRASAEAKRRFLKAIAAARSGSPGGADAKDAYRAMHESLAAFRSQRHQELEELKLRARSLQARFDDEQIAASRTWPCQFYEPEALAELRDRVRLAFEVDAAAPATDAPLSRQA